jgi:hypothetical protein
MEQSNDLLRKYKESMHVLGFSGEWFRIEEAVAKDADKVVPLLVALAEATVTANASYKATNAITKKTHPKQKDRWAAEEAANQVYIKDMRKQDEAKTALQVALVGEDELIRLKREQEEREEAFEKALQDDYDGVYDE